MTKPKLKVMHEVEAKHAQEVTAPKAEHKAKPESKPKTEPDPEIERAFEALVKLGGKATSPELVKELGYEGESARDRVRRLMDRLHDAHRIHRTHEGKKYVFTIPEPKAEPTIEVATA